MCIRDSHCSLTRLQWTSSAGRERAAVHGAAYGAAQVREDGSRWRRGNLRHRARLKQHDLVARLEVGLQIPVRRVAFPDAFRAQLLEAPLQSRQLAREEAA